MPVIPRNGRCVGKHTDKVALPYRQDCPSLSHPRRKSWRLVLPESNQLRFSFLTRQEKNVKNPEVIPLYNPMTLLQQRLYQDNAIFENDTDLDLLMVSFLAFLVSHNQSTRDSFTRLPSAIVSRVSSWWTQLFNNESTCIFSTRQTMNAVDKPSMIDTYNQDDEKDGTTALIGVLAGAGCGILDTLMSCPVPLANRGSATHCLAS